MSILFHRAAGSVPLRALPREVARAVRVAAVVAWGPQRTYVFFWAAAVFAFLFALRGGLTPAPHGRTWPWPVGTVRMGQGVEPYLFLLLHPQWLLTFQLYSVLRWVGLAVLIAWGAGLLRQTACCAPARGRGQTWAAGMSGGLAGVAGAAASCCGTAIPALAGLTGLGALSPTIDAMTAAGMVGLILVKGWALRDGAGGAPEPGTRATVGKP